MEEKMTVTLELTAYEQGRMAALLGRERESNPFPAVDDGVSDWAVWFDGYCHIEEMLLR